MPPHVLRRIGLLALKLALAGFARKEVNGDSVVTDHDEPLRLVASGVAAGTLRRMGREGDLACPQCGERVFDAEKYTVGQQQRATCPQCRAELVRHADEEDKTWKVEQSTPLLEEEPGGGD